MMVSKMKIYELIPQRYYPKTALIMNKTSFETVCKIVQEQLFSFPIITKPDIGLRGSAVKNRKSRNAKNIS
jgi:hypothetical protein